MSHQNRSAQRRPANIVPNLKHELQVDTNQQRDDSSLNNLQRSQEDTELSAQSKMERLDRYAQLLDELNVEHAEMTQAYTNLETDIMNREIACGRLMRQHLEIGEKIRLQKEVISAQKEELKRIHTQRGKTSMHKDAVVTKIATLASSSIR